MSPFGEFDTETVRIALCEQYMLTFITVINNVREDYLMSIFSRIKFLYHIIIMMKMKLNS